MLKFYNVRRNIFEENIETCEDFDLVHLWTFNGHDRPWRNVFDAPVNRGSHSSTSIYYPFLATKLHLVPNQYEASETMILTAS